jgi:hypothetical protein
MLFKVDEIEGITAHNDRTMVPFMAIECRMTQRNRVDALAELCECMGDDEFIAAVREMGFEIQLSSSETSSKELPNG